MDTPTASAPSTPSSSPTPSAPAGGASPSTPTSAQTSAQPSQPRVNGGKFGPKDGGQSLPSKDGEGEGTQEQRAQPTEAQKQAWRLKTKIKVFGKEEELDLDEEGVTRELQQFRALRKQFGPLTETSKKAQQLLELAEKDPRAFLAATGKDPKKLAAELLAQEAKLGTMTPEERRIHELESKIKEIEDRDAQAEAERTESERKAKLNEVATRNEQRFMGLLEKSQLGKTHENLYYLAETDSLMRKKGIELSDDQLIGETKRRLGSIAKAHYTSMPVEQLASELGEGTIQKLIALEVAKFEKTHGLAPAPAVTAAPPEAPAGPTVVTESEVKARLKRLQEME